MDIARGNRSLVFLSNTSGQIEPDSPRVSIIIPARNEEKNIRQALHSVLNQNYPNLEFVVLNDRSTDNTGAILGKMAAEDNRLRVETISELPQGWLGKNYALYLGAKLAAGELLLFMDADVVMHPDTVARAVNYCQAQRLDHLAILPDVVAPTLPLRLFCSAFGIFFSMYIRPAKAKDSRFPNFIGIGAFNLVRKQAYEFSGTHEAIAMRPDDDVKLGKLLKSAGFRQEMVLGMGLLSVEWYPSLRQLIDGLMKNAFAGINYSLALSVCSGIAVLLLNVWPFAALFVTAGITRILYLLTVLVMVWFVSDCNHFFGLPRWYTAAHPFSALLFVYIIWKSTALTLWTRGINWRGTHYPLALLKANRV